MRTRTIGKIAIGLLAIVSVVLAVIYIFEMQDWPQDAKHGVRAISFGILSLTAVTAYRYFED